MLVSKRIWRWIRLLAYAIAFLFGIAAKVGESTFEHSVIWLSLPFLFFGVAFFFFSVLLKMFIGVIQMLNQVANRNARWNPGLILFNREKFIGAAFISLGFGMVSGSFWSDTEKFWQGLGLISGGLGIQVGTWAVNKLLTK